MVVGRIDASFHLTSGFLCAKTRCKTNSGGLQSFLSQEQRQEEEEKSVQRLVAEFPCLVREVPEIHLLRFFLSFSFELLFKSLQGVTIQSNFLTILAWSRFQWKAFLISGVKSEAIASPHAV